MPCTWCNLDADAKDLLGDDVAKDLGAVKKGLLVQREVELNSTGAESKG